MIDFSVPERVDSYEIMFHTKLNVNWNFKKVQEVEIHGYNFGFSIYLTVNFYLWKFAGVVS